MRTRKTQPRPQVGMTVKVYGHDCRIYKVRKFGTIDVIRLDGSRAYRLSGLNFI